jgi:hypothetical protein
LRIKRRFLRNAPFILAASAEKTAVPGLNCVLQNLPYIQVLTVQRERQEVGGIRNVCNWAAIGKNRHCLNGKDWAVCGLSVYGFASSFGCRSATVMIGGRPAARMGDFTLHGGLIVLGCPMVIIGG